MSRYIKIFKVKDGDTNKNNKLKSICIDDGKLLEKYKIIWTTKIEDLKNIELIKLPVYEDRYIETKIRAYGYKIYNNFRGLNAPDTECESFTVTFTDFLLVYKNKHYLQTYTENCAYRIANKQMTDYLDDNLFKTDYY